MQHYERDIELDVILPDIKAGSKKQAFMAIGDALEQVLKIPSNTLCHELMRKEERASSAHGQGVSIPEIQLRSMDKPLTVFARLHEPVDFNAWDDRPVDLICVVLYPQKQRALHLRRLSRISRLFKSEELCERIRETNDEISIRALIHNPDGWMLAA